MTSSWFVSYGRSASKPLASSLALPNNSDASLMSPSSLRSSAKKYPDAPATGGQGHGVAKYGGPDVQFAELAHHVMRSGAVGWGGSSVGVGSTLALAKGKNRPDNIGILERRESLGISGFPIHTRLSWPVE